MLERIPIGWNHPIDKNTLKINLLEHVLIGKVSQLFRNMLQAYIETLLCRLIFIE
jgi:hypothetical protein